MARARAEMDAMRAKDRARCWERLCAATSAEYPFAREDTAAAANLYSFRCLRPVVASIVKALPALALALVRVVCGRKADAGVAFRAADTVRNRLAVARLRKTVDGLPPPTGWAAGGDLATLVPFLLFGEPERPVVYKRRWLRVARAPMPDGVEGHARRGGQKDDEAIALDVAAPEAFDEEAPVMLILHGLNGGSAEPYVQDLVLEANRRGWVAAVLVARGLMGTPVRESVFAGSRTSDVGAAVDCLRGAYGDRVALVGVSMGGIVAANYAARAGAGANLLCCAALSGTMCSEVVLGPCGDRTRRLWHPALAYFLKGTFLGPFGRLARRKRVDAAAVEACATISDFDTALVCPFHGYRGIAGPGGYYEDMSACGAGDAAGLRAFGNLATPLLLLHARDDPIVPYESVLADRVAEHDRVVLVTTASGGHTGWPRGRDPRVARWAFQTRLALDFALACRDSRPFRVDVGDGPIFDGKFQVRQTSRSRAAYDQE